MTNFSCFGNNDIRGIYGKTINKDLAFKIGQAISNYLNAKHVVIGGDARLSTPALKSAVIEGLRNQGTNVIDIGLCGTEEIYFATTTLKVDGGIMITASHNPKQYNGLKIVSKNAKPISKDSGLLEIEKLAVLDHFPFKQDNGRLTTSSLLTEYIEFIEAFVNSANLGPLKIAINSLNGAAGHVIDSLEKSFIKQNVPITFIKLNHEPNGHFPNGSPNPMNVNNHDEITRTIQRHDADFGVVLDGDFDRCFLFDETGNFIESYYIVGLLTEVFLKKKANGKIVHDSRLIWNTLEIAESNGGQAIQCKAGHSFIKERMRKEQAIYGGEMSGHHYFKDFFYCDSGIIPWLLIAELTCLSQKSLSSLVKTRIEKFPSSGEINITITNHDNIISRLKDTYQSMANTIDTVDGLSMNFNDWRFNLRKSNTEPVLRLNVEARQSATLLRKKTKELLKQINL